MIFDEDDRFGRNYTMNAILPIVQGYGKLTMNKEMVHVTDEGIGMMEYSTWYGTLAGRTGNLRAAMKTVTARYPEGFNKRPRTGTPVPLDGALMAAIQSRYGARIVEHDGTRYYFVHKDCSSVKNGHMPKSKSIN